MGDRVWVDLEQCKKLVDNICITFQTKPSSGSQSGAGEGVGSSAKSSSSDTTSGGTSGGGGGGEKEDTEVSLTDDVDVEPR